ncbi:MAG: hypothetical protein ACLQM8_06830 [Limisphaerales bacterium]
MNLRRKGPPDSLYMLLDTMCNAFGGIVLLAVLVTLLTSKETGNEAGAPDSREMLERRLALARANLQHSLEFSASLREKADDPRHRQEIALLAARKELQGNLQQSRDAATMASKELEATGTTDPSERLKFLNEQLAAAEARRLERQNSLSAAAENSSRLKQRLEALQAQVARIINDSQRLLRLPLERETGKRPLFVIVEYGHVYPCLNVDLSRNESTINWVSKGEGRAANPIEDRGYTSVDANRLRDFFNLLPKDLIYLVFCVFEDSFAEFNQAKEMAVARGLAYGWEPLRNEDGPILLGPTGHTPKPQ